MGLLSKMNLAIDYIERHITDELDLPALARLACCSTYSFQRMFAFVTGVTVTEYIRRRRMTLAALDLQQRNIKIMDVALKYSYECV